ncbi:MAG TPA: DUF192 domain-containing protein [Actinomycetota bacterium]|nr:DUF192 domain-containing protein [Actinomycetota bacterium]
MQLVDPDRRISVEILEAKGMLGTMQGLLGQAGLPPGTGVRLRTKQVHTVGMRFAIDTIYLSPKGTVMRVATMPPGRIGPIVLRARWILEMGAGEAARLGIVPGGTLVPAGR